MQASSHLAASMESGQPVRIVGQGLTGTLLALALHERGIPFVVQDVPLPGSATPVAPGIVNPLAGRRFRPPEGIGERLEEVQSNMEQVARVLDIRIWHACPILRMFAEPTQVDRFERNLSRDTHEAFVEERFQENTFPYINDVFGSFLTRGGGWADLPTLKSAARKWLADTNRLEEAPFNPRSTTFPEKEITCFCEGWQIAENPHWSFIPHNPAKGEMLIVRFEESLPRDRIFNQSCWIQPIGGGVWRAGATYSWARFNSQPEADGVEELKEKLKLLTPVPFTVEEEVAGVRPIVEDYRPVVGRHPERRNWYVVNALGSKGVLQAPGVIEAFLDLLLEGRDVPQQWCLSRFTN